MPLPQDVINKLSQDAPVVSERSSGLLLFSFSLLAVTIAMYLVVVFGYDAYLNNQSTNLSAQIGKVSQSVSSAQAGSFISFYSQIVNTRTLLANHIAFSHVLAWLEKDTQANAYYQSFAFVSGNQVTLGVLAKSQGDMDQQLAIFESDPEIKNVAISNVSIANVSGYVSSNVTLTLNPSLFLSSGTQ
jgi:hypothetical protein